MKKIPIGIENFKRLIDDDFYYIDKTLFIRDVMDEKIAIYTRPRRFGKTLNMSMLYYFFSNKEKDNAYLFKNLAISHNNEAMKHQNQYPVIFLTLKDMKRSSYELQVQKFVSIISQCIHNFDELFTSSSLTEDEIDILKQYRSRSANESDLMDALLNITLCLEKIYHKRVIVLIDEYDVPLQAAYTHDYYDDMVEFLRSVLSTGLKTNDAVEKGIFTGCLRIAKESIFTGLNHFNVYSVLHEQSSRYFGFTNDEVHRLLDDYQMNDSFGIVKEWYDGYLFGSADIYNPWSVLKFVLKAKQDKAEPESFWANTSGNDIVVDYISKDNETLHKEFESLMQGKAITKTIKTELTYRDMDDISNIYSFLLMTGYLKVNKEIISQEKYELIIPNKEVYKIYDQSFIEYFDKLKLEKNVPLFNALNLENEETIENIITDVLKRSISYFDEKEMFYHGLLVGMLGSYDVESNRESGDGRPDIIVYPKTRRGKVIVIECKYTNNEKHLISSSEEAAKQIITSKYKEGIEAKGYKQIIGYGIAFCQKQCYVTKV